MHVSFDFDYTLADSSEGTVACANHALDELGLPRAPRAMILPTIGLTLEKTFERLTGNHGPEEAALFKRYFLDHAEHAMLDHIRFFDVTRGVLQALQVRGHYVSIVSTKERERIVDALVRDGLAGFVDHVVGGSCVVHNKPHPEGLLTAVAASGVPREQTIYVGDSVSDGECAALANITFVGVLSGQTSADTLKQWRPWRLLPHVGELTSVL
jgi:phosphoglycolate phosphatase